MILSIAITTACPPGHAVVMQWTQVNTGTIDGVTVPVLCNYRLYKSNNGATFVSISFQQGLTYIDQNVVSGQTYWYKVGAVVRGSTSETISSVQSIKIP